MKKNILLFLSLISVSLTSYSQKDTTMNRTVIVENNYNPEIMDASKINVLPKVEDFKAPKNDIRYSTNATPLTSFSDKTVDFQISEPLKRGQKNGYLRAGYGNYGNTDIFAKYVVDLTSEDRLSFETGLDGMKGKLKDWNSHDWNGRFFTSHINADYSHYFKNYLFTVQGKFKSQVFNYINHGGFDKQHNTIADVNASLSSLQDNTPINFYVKMGYRSFAQKFALGDFKQGSQGDFYINGNVWGKLNDESNVGINFEMDNLSYSSRTLDGYSALRTNPYYSLKGDDWNIRIGAHADYQTALEKGVEFAPDLLVQYSIDDRYQLYAKVDGGVILNDFYRLSSLSPYFIMNRQYLSTSVPFDGKIGFKASPMNEMWLHLFAGYRINKNELSYIVSSEPSYTQFYQDKANCVYGGGEFRYSFKDLFDINTKAVIYKWNSKAANEDLFLASKPELTLDIDLRYRVIQNLYLNGGFSYVKRIDNKDIIGDYRYKYDNLNNLYLGAEYEIFDNISVYAKLNNILNSKNFREDCYPTEKFNFIGGLSFKF